MRTTLYLLAVLLSITSVLSTPVFAELIEGQVTGVDLQKQCISIIPKNKTADLPDEINLLVKASALRKQAPQGIQSLEQLAIGDEIVVEANKPVFGEKWEAENLMTANQIQAAAGQNEVTQPRPMISEPPPSVSAGRSRPPLTTYGAIGGPKGPGALINTQSQGGSKAGKY